MAYSELIKNFEKIREYMREFYVYGFKSRSEYNKKSLRSYDDERRRIDSWLGEFMRFERGSEGKNVFLSLDSRNLSANPLFKAWKAKSFTDGDITLHFAVFDILDTPDKKFTLSELADLICERIEGFAFDDSTLRKKLAEYEREGVIKREKDGRKVYYSRTADGEVALDSDMLSFFSEVSPCGVVGSFLLDKLPPKESVFTFKHHYLTNALDSDVLAEIFDAISDRCRLLLTYCPGAKNDETKSLTLVPLRILIGVSNGRENLIAYNEELQLFGSYRLDRISNPKKGEVCADFERLRAELADCEKHMWGVNCRGAHGKTEHVEFEIAVNVGEDYIVKRLIREKRCGEVVKLAEGRYLYRADVFDTWELIPWIRSFICRIVRTNFSNRTAENSFKSDLKEMYRIYGVGGEAK